MKRFFLVLSAILLSIPFASLFVVFSANAASPYDQSITVTNQLLVQDAVTGEKTDVATDFLQHFANYPPCASAHQSFLRALDTGAWTYFIQEQETPSNYEHNTIMAYLQWHETDKNAASFYMYGGSVPVYGFENSNGIGSMRLEKFNNQVYASCSTNSAITNIISSPAEGIGDPGVKSYFKVYLSTFETEYPEGYEGEQIPETAENPGGQFDGRAYPAMTFTANIANKGEDNEYRWIKADLIPPYNQPTYPTGIRWQLVETDQNYQNGTKIHEDVGDYGSEINRSYYFDGLEKGKWYTLNAIPYNHIPRVPYKGVGVQFQFYFDDYLIRGSTSVSYCNLENGNNWLSGTDLTAPYIRCNINYELSEVPEDPADKLAQTPFGRFRDAIPTFGLTQVFMAPLDLIAKISSGALGCSQADNFGFYVHMQGYTVLNDRLPCFSDYIRPFLNAPILGYNGVNLGFTLQNILHTFVGGLVVYYTFIGYFRLLDRSIDLEQKDKIQEVRL